MKKKLIIVTGNPLKFEQIAHVLGEYFECEQGVFKTYEIQGVSEEVLKDKLVRAYKHFSAPVLVEDTSLHFDFLGGFPGPYIRDFLTCIRPYDMGKKFVGTRMNVTSRFGLMQKEDTPIIVSGVCHGVVADPTVVEPGIREFDTFFQPDGLDRPLIDFSPTEVLQFSHRGKALTELVRVINEQGLV